MALPPGFTTSQDYFVEAVAFLKEHQWVYNQPNTHILSEKILDQVPLEWQTYFATGTEEKLRRILLGQTLVDCPESLTNFTRSIERLKCVEEEGMGKCSYNFVHNSCLSQKKVHEILSLAPLIHQVCEERNVGSVIDVGCGLGYLSHLLNEKYGYSVLGIDSSTKYIDLAYKNQRKLHPTSKDVHFENHFISPDSAPKILELLRKYFPSNEKFCLVGLHACADLSVTILDLFERLDVVEGLVIMPCCYHRMELEEDHQNVETFKGFPVSDAFKRVFGSTEAKTFLRRPFLRLACQQTAKSFLEMSSEELGRQGMNCLFRAVLQTVADDVGCEVKRLKRKSGQKHSPEMDFHIYVDNLGNTHQLVERTGPPLTITDAIFKEQMWNKWCQHKNRDFLVQVLLGLQVAFQGICENLVLLDRVEFLREKGLKCCTKRVTNDCVSPRCRALVAEK